MSFCLYIQNAAINEDSRNHVPIGPGGSQLATMAMRFAGHAVGKFEERKQVARWIRSGDFRFAGDYSERQK